MSEVGAITMRRAAKRPLKRRINGAVMSALAVFITVWPLFITGIWLFNTFIYEPRGVVALSSLQQPEQVRLFEEPLVSVTFDDGWESIYSQGAPILQKHGIPTTQYVLSGFFDDRAYMSERQVLSLQAAGHDIQSHTITHANLKSLDGKQLEIELSVSQKNLSQLLGKDVNGFASPLSSFSTREVDRIKAYYLHHRNTYADLTTVDKLDVNTAETFDAYNIVAYTVHEDTKVQDISRFLNYAKQHKAWAVLVYHEISDNSKSRYNVTPNDLDKQMRAIKHSGVKAATVTQVMDDYNSRIRRSN